MGKENHYIIIVNPPNPPNSVSNKDMMGGFGQLYPSGATTKIPPIDLLYSAALLKKGNLSFDIVDCLIMDYDNPKLINYLRKKVLI
jgi:hypothetical protein